MTDIRSVTPAGTASEHQALPHAPLVVMIAPAGAAGLVAPTAQQSEVDAQDTELSHPTWVPKDCVDQVVPPFEVVWAPQPLPTPKHTDEDGQPIEDTPGAISEAPVPTAVDQTTPASEVDNALGAMVFNV